MKFGEDAGSSLDFVAVFPRMFLNLPANLSQRLLFVLNEDIQFLETRSEPEAQ